jgi:hypothetical protein
VLEVSGFKYYLTCHPVDAPDGMSELMLSSEISRNIFFWVLVQVDNLWNEIMKIIINK